MKIRTAFVSNSSSASFIIGINAYDNVLEITKHIIEMMIEQIIDWDAEIKDDNPI